ncbi:MAG: PaaX family transcriptional regulator [Jatrophihabitans sp.]|nr:MAG: PaaX family transcriptional regulator [Jatrophihabitans sp.]
MTDAVRPGGPAPRMSRRHAAGAGSARGLLFTVLGEFVLPAGGTVWTSSIIEVLGRLGVEEKAARQALMRTAADGWLVSERHGRRTRWSLTPSAERLLVDGTRRIYEFGRVAADWDGRLVLVLARVPEADRAARHLLNTRLSWAGYGTPGPGVWISTHAERIAEVEQLLRHCDVQDARIFRAEHVGGADLAGMVRQAWDLDAVEARYRQFLAEFAAARTHEPLPRLIELVHAWRRFPAIDPALPRDLLPRRWIGERAAALFARRHAEWGAEASAAWLRLDAPPA